jgi:anti-sigma factor RsiW
MREQHLSDEAIAAFADDVLSGSARERAQRHTATCAECNYAVAVQREAVWALRSAPAPTLSSDLLQRLREVPTTTPIRQVPTHLDERGTEMFATFAAPAAALVPPARPSGRGRTRRGRPLVITAASVAVLGALAGTAVAADSAPAGHPGVRHPVSDAQLVRAQLPVHPW